MIGCSEVQIAVTLIVNVKVKVSVTSTEEVKIAVVSIVKVKVAFGIFFIHSFMLFFLIFSFHPVTLTYKYNENFSNVYG